MRARALLAFAVAFILTAVIVSIPALTHDSLHTIFQRTIEYQSNRGSPFSVWGLYGPRSARPPDRGAGGGGRARPGARGDPPPRLT